MSVPDKFLTSQNAHIREVAKAAYPLYLMAYGTLTAVSEEEFIAEVAHLICILEQPEVKDSDFAHGMIVVQRGPHDGWQVLIRAANVFRWSLAKTREEFQEVIDSGGI